MIKEIRIDEQNTDFCNGSIVKVDGCDSLVVVLEFQCGVQREPGEFPKLYPKIGFFVGMCLVEKEYVLMQEFELSKAKLLVGTITIKQ